jgi:hypothetical protein
MMAVRRSPAISQVEILFASQSHHWIDPHRTARRKVTGDQCHHHQPDGKQAESQRILRPDPKQLVRHQARQSRRAANTPSRIIATLRAAKEPATTLSKVCTP